MSGNKRLNEPNSVDEFDEEIKYWSKIAAKDIEIIAEYLKSMGFFRIVIVGLNEWSEKLISAIKDRGITLFLCPDSTKGVETEGVTVCSDLSRLLKEEEIDLIIDADGKKYNMRRYLYDGFHCESCLIYQILKKIYTDERFRWKRNNVEHQEEMLNEFFDIVKSRYKNVAVYGNGEVVYEFLAKLKKIFDGNVEHITNNDIVISDKGQKIEIIKYCANEINDILYFGVCKEINFYRSGKKLQVINANEIFQEIYMNYDLANGLVNKLKNKDVECFCFLYPDFYRLNDILRSKGFPCFKRTPLLINMFNDSRYEQNLKAFFLEYYSREYIMGILKRPNVIEINSIKRYNDFHSPFYNVVNGNRVTTDIPENTVHTIHFFGKCAAMGRFVEDKNTIPSFLQRMINETTRDYQVINYGMEADVEINKKIRNIRFKKGDIVFIFYRYYEIYKKCGIPFTDLTQLISDIVMKNRGYFLDSPEHFNHKVNEKIARVMFETLSREYSVDEAVLNSKEYFKIEDNYSDENDFATTNPQFKSYIEELKNNKKTDSGKTGAIVMNCNPFTLGHKYLISQAAAMCDTLYIFVVEEDKSVFSFKDRFRLVEEGTKEFKNVIVMPSGSFMISTLTFPEYFNKDAPSAASVDPSADVELFGRYIAPALGITVRFAGEEPIDPLTRQYNDVMKKILPSFGVEFKIIPRKESDGMVISASRVRKYLNEGDFDEIAKIVPETTLEFLKAKFK